MNLKYKEFDQYKKEVEEIKAKNLDPDVNAKLVNNKDLLKELDKEIEELEATKNKLTKYLHNNNEALKEYEDDRLPTDLEELIKENKILKKKTQEERRREEERMHKEIMGSLKPRREEDLVEHPSTNLKILKNERIEEADILNSTIYKAVEALKLKKKEIETKEERERVEKTKRREELFAGNEELISRMKALETEKVKLRQELNKYESMALEIESSKKRDKDSKVKSHQSQEIQTDSKESLLVLRRDYSGIVGKNRFDDRINVLGNNFSTKISRVIVY